MSSRAGNVASGGPDARADTAFNGLIKFIVNVHSLSFTISCGKGGQSISWLANAAAQRFARSQSAAGRSKAMKRQYSTNNASKSAAFYLPQCVRRNRDTVRSLLAKHNANLLSVKL
jgi:hypothetical protein